MKTDKEEQRETFEMLTGQPISQDAFDLMVAQYERQVAENSKASQSSPTPVGAPATQP